MKHTSKLSTKDIIYIGLFAALIAVCAWIAIPSAVPFTLQTFGVFTAVGLLGGKRGTLAVLVYLLLGMVGAPVFAGFAGGLGVLMGNTGGYILGFVFSALTMWGMEKVFGKKKWVLPVSMILGLLVCYVFGTAWFMNVYASQHEAVGLWTALTWCVIPYLIPDGIKILGALLICDRVGRYGRI